MFPANPVEGLQRNDLETSAWSDVERKTHAEMLGFPEWVCVANRAQTACQGSRGRQESGTMDQTPTTKRNGKRRGKPASKLSTAHRESDPQGDLDPKGENLP